MYLTALMSVSDWVMIWLTPSSRNAQVVARSAVGGGIEYGSIVAMRSEVFGGRWEERLLVALTNPEHGG
jgi:hypothetical protein